MTALRANPVLLVLLTIAVAGTAWVVEADSERRKINDGEAAAWATIEEVRAGLIADSPLTAEFSQTFTPAGFSGGDVETGVLALQLPECARWDYGDPFPKSFLLCGELAYAWNPGEASGRRYQVTVDEREGLDLLRLDITQLRRRYTASSSSAEGSYRVLLEPRVEETLLTQATLTLTDDRTRLATIAFRDRDGNRTLFELGSFDSLASADAFAPPPDIEWLQE